MCKYNKFPRLAQKKFTKKNDADFELAKILGFSSRL